MHSDRKKVVILGAGVSGLAAAYRLSHSKNYEIHVVDKAPQVGGLCRSFSVNDFILDHGPHKFYTLLDGIVAELQSVMKGELLTRDKTQMLYLCERYFQFPLRMSEMILKFPPTKTAGILLTYAQQILKNLLIRSESETYEAFVIERFGKGLYQQIFEPLAKKIYGNPADLDRKLAEVRISSPGLVSVVKQMLLKNPVDRTVSAPEFYYPKQGYGEIPNRLEQACRKNGVQFHLDRTILSIEASDGPRAKAVVVQDGPGKTETLPCDELIYSIPPTFLTKLLPQAHCTPALKRACQWTRFRHTIVYYYLLKKPSVLPAMWVFFPEAQFRFGRLSEMTKFSPQTAPPGHTALMVDFTCLEEDPTWAMDDTQLGDYLEKQMTPLGLFKKEDIVQRFSKRFRNVYPIYHKGYQDNVGEIRKLEKEWGNLYFIGRLGDFNYNNADQCLDMGFRVGDHILSKQSLSEWTHIRTHHFDQYRIVD